MEGFDLEVLRTLGLTQLRTTIWVILYEHVHLSAADQQQARAILEGRRGKGGSSKWGCRTKLFTRDVEIYLPGLVST